MAERLPLLLLRVGVDQHHQRGGIVSGAEQKVVHRVERLLIAFGGDGGDVAARVLGPDVVVEEHDPAPVAARAEDAHVVPHLASPFGAREDLAQASGSSSAHGGSAVSRNVVP